MIIVFGFRTPAAVEVPKVLYIGDDGSEAMRIADESEYPRVAHVTNPHLIARRHWSEAASEAFEKGQGEKLGPPNVPGPTVFTVEGGETPGEQKLEDLTITELKELAEKEGANLAGATLKVDIILAIEKHRAVAAGNLDALTVEELKALAAEKGVELKGVNHKADIIKAIKSG